MLLQQFGVPFVKINLLTMFVAMISTTGIATPIDSGMRSQQLNHMTNLP
jgi:hypothetical protein